MDACVRLGTCSQPQSHCLLQKAHPNHLCQTEIELGTVKGNGMGFAKDTVVDVEILWVGICAPPVVVDSGESWVHHHLQQVMFDVQTVVKVKLTAAQRKAHQRRTVLQPGHQTTQGQIVIEE